ncbi:MAG: thioredoxin family protein [Acidobacteriota bacterium]|nr:thioredoxin family protein [Acidobacteriota bacterium]
MNLFAVRFPRPIAALIALTASLMLAPLVATAQQAGASAAAPHLQVELLVPAQSIQRGGQPAQAGLYFKLDPTWHIYWINAGDAGDPPHVAWTMPKGVTASALQFPAPRRLPLGPLMDFGYEDEVVFPFTISAASSASLGPATLHAKVDWIVCQNSCIPGKADLEITRTISASASTAATNPLIEKFIGLLPRPLPSADKALFQQTPSGFRLSVDTGQPEKSAIFYPADQDFIDNPAPQNIAATSSGFVLDLKKSPYYTDAPKVLNGVIELSGGRTYQLSAKPGTVAAVATAPQPSTEAVHSGAGSSASSQSAPSPAGMESSGSLLRSTLFAFLGGLLLNLMPCVFPVLFIKGLSLVNSGQEERSTLRKHGFVYTLGILASFWALVAALLVLRSAGHTLGWGFQFQSPQFVMLMACLLFFLGLSLAGQFEIGLTLTSAGGSLAQKQGLSGSFFTGILAVIVATPCTAPFMGAALGYALTQSAIVTFAVFTALALGLATPYVALTLQPAWTRFLPRPGAWMDVLKQAISVPIFATVIWLAWVVTQGYGAAVLVALLAAFLLLAIAGWFLGRWPAKRWATTVATLVILGVLAICAFAPGRLFSYPAPSSASSSGSAWQPWSAQSVADARAQGKPVFIDFTASWCLSCQVNERLALTRPEVKAAFAAHHVVLFKADWTRHDDAITDELTALGRSGVPTYALYVPGEKSPRLLPEALTPGIVLDALASLPR